MAQNAAIPCAPRVCAVPPWCQCATFFAIFAIFRDFRVYSVTKTYVTMYTFVYSVYTFLGVFDPKTVNFVKIMYTV